MATYIGLLCNNSHGLSCNNLPCYAFSMNTTTAANTNKRPADSNGFRPTSELTCDNSDECTTCGALGWILCDHDGADIETDLFNADGYHYWCTRCDTPTTRTAWTWCPERTN